MKTFPLFLKQNLRGYLILICVVCLPHIAVAIEPIATIGQPRPEKYAFLDSHTILRVVRTHIQVVDADTGEVVDEFGKFEDGYDVMFSPTGSHFVSQDYIKDSKAHTVSIWDANAREKISEWTVEDRIDLVTFSPIEPILAASINDRIYLWNWEEGEFIGEMFGKRRPSTSCFYVNGRRSKCHSPVRDMSAVFSPDGKYLIVASMRPDIELWNVETRQLEAHFEGHTGNWVEGIAISSDGNYLATFEEVTATIYVWNMDTRRLLWKAKNGDDSITDIQFSPDRQQLFVATSTRGLSKSGFGPWEGWDDMVRVWDVKSGQQIDSFNTEFRRLQAMTLSPDGKTMLLEYSDAGVLWDIQKKETLHMWGDFNGYVFSTVRLSPDGKTVVNRSRNYIKTWDVASQQMQLLVSANGYQFEGLAISPDSQKIAVIKDSWIELRDIHTGKVEAQLLNPSGFSSDHHLAFSQSGKLLAVGSYSRGMLILDVKGLKEIQRIQPKIGPDSPIIYHTAFSENDEYLAATAQTRISNNNYKHWILLWKRIGETFVLQYTWEVQGSESKPAFFTNRTDGSTVLATPGAKGIQIWKLLLDSAELLTTLEGSPPIRFSPDGRYLYSAAQIWDWQTNRPINNPSYPWFEDISQDGSVLLSYKMRGQYQVYDVKHTLSLLPYAVEPKDKKIVTLGEIKRNQLLQNFPNPFNPETWIPFQLADKNNVTIQIYTPTGNLVRTLSLGVMSEGDYSSQNKAIHWDGCNNQGEPVSSGIYLYTINAGDFSATRKMLIRK